VTTPIRTTHVGPELNKNYDAEESAVAFNSQNNEYLIVFEGTDSIIDTGTSIQTAVEIYAQRINASTNVPESALIKISTMGPSGDTKYDARKPDVAYNPQSNEYMVVWYGDTNSISGANTVEGEFEIWGRRINASNGQSIGAQFKISDMGPTANRSYDAIDPVIAYNEINNNFMVVWRGEEGILSNAIGEFEIYGQQLNASGGQIGVNDFKISNMGTDGQPIFDAYSPAIAYNKTNNEFMVVWYGDNNTNGHVSGEFEIYGQRLNASSGAEVGVNDFQISETGVPGFVTRSAQFPSVAWNSIDNQYLVVWSADPATGIYVGNEFEIFGQTLAANGNEIGEDDFPISHIGPAGNNNFDAFRPNIKYLKQSQEYLVAYRADTDVDGEFEIFMQRLDAKTQIRLGQTSQRLSHAGTDGLLTYDARRVDLGYNSNTGEALIIWEQEDDNSSQVLGELEIYASTMSPSDFTIDYTTSGSWFDTNRNGEGYILEMLPNNGVLMMWFTYLPNQAEQAWLIGTGTYSKNRIILENVQITSGGVFGPAFDPTAVQRQVWGDISFEFDGCNSGVINYNAQSSSYGDGDHVTTRLTSLSGANCATHNASTDVLDGISGAWYDPTHDGEGWFLEYLGNNNVLMYWFSYDNLGNQKWMLDVGTIDANNLITFANMSQKNGTFFGDNFNSGNVNNVDWGTMQMQINDCNSLSVSYDSIIGIYGQGALNASKIVGIDQIECGL
jgi:hypothetical protein